MEASDDGLYVVKFRGAGQGPKALIAEVVAGELARLLGLPMPEIAFVEVDPVLGLAEPDPEIQELIAASAGLNLGIDFLPGAIAYDTASFAVDPSLAAAVVWFDALITNVDRTPRNPNLLVWHERLWLIDHGAAFYVHHASASFASRAAAPFPAVREHVLLPVAGSVLEADERLAPMLTDEALAAVLDLVPVEWLADGAAGRSEYLSYLSRRLAAPRAFAAEAEAERVRGG